MRQLEQLSKMWISLLPIFLLLLVLLCIATGQNIQGTGFGLGYSVGGQPARSKEVPYQLSVRRNGCHFCGATLVRSPVRTLYAISAAHCFFDNNDVPVPASNFSVMAGSNRLYGKTEQVLLVRKIVVHMDFEPRVRTFENDIAVLFLNGHFQLDDYIQPAILADMDEQYFGNVVVSGWGRTVPKKTNCSAPVSLAPFENSILPQVHYTNLAVALATNLPRNCRADRPVMPYDLQVLKLPMISNERCAELYARCNDQIFEGMMCAGLEKGGMDPCMGDSGGPAAVQVGTKWILQGVISTGAGCGQPGFPGIYTRVAFYRAWIDKVAKLYQVFALVWK